MKKVLFSVVTFLPFMSFCQIGFHQIVNQKRLENYGFEIWKGKQKTTICGDVKGIVSVSQGSVFLDIWQQPKYYCTGINFDSTFQKLELKDGRKKFGDPTKILSLPMKSYSIGLNALPFRYRFKFKNEDAKKIKGSTLSAFQLAISVGRVWGRSYVTSRNINNYTFSVNAFLGPTAVVLDKTTVKSPLFATELGNSSQNNAALAYGLNLIIARNNLGIVFAIGKDRAIGKNASEWIYNNKPWIGFGVNTGFLR